MIKSFTFVRGLVEISSTMSEENGFLTDTDRKFLMGEKEYSGDNAKHLRYQRRRAIAERARQALHDFGFLFDMLNEHERNRIFDPPEEDESDLYQALYRTISFLYYSLEGNKGAKPAFMRNRSLNSTFKQILEPGVQFGEQARYPDDVTVIVDVTFDVDSTPVAHETVAWDPLIEKLAERDLNEIDPRNLRLAMSQATNPTDRLRELADLIEERRGGDRWLKDDEYDFGHSSDDLADAARSVQDMMEDSDGTEE